jgi:hypothetical protein
MDVEASAIRFASLDVGERIILANLSNILKTIAWG